jgi:hypothetical protein
MPPPGIPERRTTARAAEEADIAILIVRIDRNNP